MDPLSLTASIIAIVGAGGSVGKGLKKLASIRHAERDLVLLQDDVSDLQLLVGNVSEIILEFEKTTKRPSYQRIGRALERTKSTILDLEKLIVYNLTTTADSHGKLRIDPWAWITHEAAVRNLRTQIGDRERELLTALSFLNLSTQMAQLQQQRSFDRKLENGWFNDRNLLAEVQSVGGLTTQSLERQSQHETTLRRIEQSVKSTTTLSDHVFPDIPHLATDLPQQAPDDPRQTMEEDVLQAMLHSNRTKYETEPRISRSNRPDRLVASSSRPVVDNAPAQNLSSSSVRVVSMAKEKSISRPLSMTEICNEQCDCICHRGSNTKSPNFAVVNLGPLFIVFKGSSPVNTCVSRSCKYITLKFGFTCPQWLANWAWESTSVFSKDTKSMTLRASSSRLASESDPIFWAARTGALDHVRRIVQQRKVQRKGLINDISYPEGKTIVHVAVESLNLNILRELMSHGANPFTASSFGTSPYTEAWTMILGGSPTVPGTVLGELRHFIDGILSPDNFDEFGFTALHRQCVGLSSRSFEEIVLETPRSAVDLGDAAGRTSLSWAAQRGDWKLVRRLLSFGSHPDKPDYSGKSSLHWSLSAGGDECLLILLDAKADIAAKDKLGRTPLCLAVQMGTSLKFVKALLTFGADPNSKDGHGMMPLLWAAHYDRPEILSCLLRNGASINDTDPNGRTILHIAISLNNYGVLKLILKYWPMLCSRADRSQRNLIHLAACLGDLSTLKILQTASLGGLKDADGVDCTGTTPLQYAQWRLMNNEDWSNLVIEPRDKDPLEWYRAFKALLASCWKTPEESSVQDPFSHSSLHEVLTELGSDEEDGQAWEDAPERVE